MLQTWKNIVLNWINCYFTESLVKEQNLSVESLHNIISHLRENLNLDESKSSTLEAFSIEEFLSEKYPDFKFEDGTVEPKNEDEYYLVASLLLFFVCTNSKDLDIKYAMCSKLKTQDQEVILKYSKSLMHVTQVKYKDVYTAILEACQEAVGCPPPRSITSETPPSLRSLHSEVRRLQAALDAERFDNNFLQEELSRNNVRLEKLSKEKEECKLEILNLKANISLCCGQEKLPLSQSGDSNSTKFLKQVQDLEDRLVHTQEQLEETQYDRDLCRTKINELKQERQKWHHLNQQLATQIDQLQEELDTEKRLSQSYKELVHELTIHNQRNFLDNSQLEWDELEASIHSLPHNTSITSENAAKPNLSNEMVTLKEELHSKLIIEIEQMKTQNYCYVSSLKKEIDFLSNNFQKCKNELHDKEETIDKLAFEITALKKDLENNTKEFDALGKQNVKLEHENKIIKDLFETEKNVSYRIIEEKRKQLEDILSELGEKNILLENVEKKNNELSEALNNERKEKLSILKDKEDLGHENKVLIDLLESVKHSASSTINEKQSQIDKFVLEIDTMNKSILNFEEEQRELQLVIHKSLLDTALYEKRILELERQNNTLKNDAEIEKTSLQNVLKEKENIITELIENIKSLTGERQALTDDIVIHKQQLRVIEEKHKDLLETEKNMYRTLEERQKHIDDILSELSEKNDIIKHIKKANNELSEALENELKEKLSIMKEKEELSHENKILKDSLETARISASSTINEKQSYIDKLVLEINNMNKSILNLEEEKQTVIDNNQQDIALFEKRILDLDHLNKTLKDDAEIEKTSLQNVLKEKGNILKEYVEKMESLTGERQALTDDIVKHKQQIRVLEGKHKELLDTEKNMYRTLEEKQKHIDNILSELSEKNDEIEHIKKGNNELSEALENELKEKTGILKEKEELGQENKILKDLLETVQNSASSTINEKQLHIDKLVLEKDHNLQHIALYEKRILDLALQNNTLKGDAEIEKISLQNVLKEKENIITEFIEKIESSIGERKALTDDIGILKQQITVIEEKHQQLLEKEKNMYITLEEKQKRIEDIMSELSEKNDVIENIKKVNNELSEAVKNEEKEKTSILQDKNKLERENKILLDLLETAKSSASSTIDEKQSEIDKLILETDNMNKLILNLEEEKRELQSVVHKNLQDIALYEKRVLEVECKNYKLKDDAELEKTSLQNVLKEKEILLEEFIKKTESLTREREALNDDLIIHKQQTRHLEEKHRELLETEKNMSCKIIEEKQKHIENIISELSQKNHIIEQVKKDNKELREVLKNEQKEIVSILKDKEELVHENKIIKDLLETAKNSASSTIDEKQSEIDKLVLATDNMNNLILNLEEEKRALQSVVHKNLQDIALYEKRVLEVECKNYKLKDDAELEKTSLQNVLKEKEILLEEFIKKTESLTREREALNDDLIIHKQQTRHLEEKHRELLETEKNMSCKIIEEKQKHIENIISELSQKNHIIEQVKKDNKELREVLKNEQKEIVSILKDKEELVHENKIIKDLLETAKNSASSTIDEKQSEIDKLVLATDNMNNLILNLEEEKRALQSVVHKNLQDIALYEKRVLEVECKNYTLKDEAELEKTSLQNVLKEKEILIEEFIKKTESLTREREALNDDLIVHKQQTRLLEEKHGELLETEKNMSCKIIEEKQKHIEDIMSELSQKNHIIEQVKKDNKELREVLKNEQKEIVSILKDKEELVHENKIIKDLLETAKNSASSTIDEKQSEIDKLVLATDNMNNLILNLEEEKRELQSVVHKNLQDIALYEKRVLEVECKNYTLKDDAELEKTSLKNVLKEKEILLEEFIKKTESLTREREALNDDLIIHKQQTRHLEEKHRELLETEKNMSCKIIEEKQKHIEDIISELSQKNHIIEQVKKDNKELREVLKNEQKEIVSILKDKEELVHENKIIKDLLETAKNSASSTIDEKQSEIDKLVLATDNMNNLILNLEEEKRALQSVVHKNLQDIALYEKRVLEVECKNYTLKDEAELEKTSLQNVLKEKEILIEEFIKKTESLTREREALNDDLIVHKQQTRLLEEKHGELLETEKNMSCKIIEEKQKHIEDIMSELSQKNHIIEQVKKDNKELREVLKNEQKEIVSILKDKEELVHENKIIKDLLETAKNSASSTIDEKQSEIDKLVLATDNMNNLILNLEEEKRELQSVVHKNLQDIALYEKRVLEVECKNYTLKDDAELEKTSLKNVLKEKEILLEEFIKKTESLTREREALNDDLIIHKQQTRHLEEKHRELLETEKNMSCKIIEEKQKHIEDIISELSQKNHIIEQVKKDNKELREVLKNEQKEIVSILKDKEELVHENKIIKDLLETAKNSASSTNDEKQSQIDELVLQIVNMNKSKDNAEIEQTSQQHVLTENENIIKEFIEKTESLTHEKQALNDDIAVLKQHIRVLKEKENELANRLQTLLLEHAQCEDTINNLKEQIHLCNLQIVNFKVNDEVKRVIELLNNQREQLNDRDSIILKLITEKDAVIGSMSKELLEEKESKVKYQKELESKNFEVTELKLQISDLKKEERMNYLRRENDELIKAVGQKETLTIVSQEKSGSKCNQSEKQQRMYFQVDNSAPFDNTQSSLESYKTISDLEKIIQDKNRTITTLQSDLTYMKSLMAESENKLLDVNKELEIQKETCDQLSSQLKKIVNQKNDEIADLKKQLNKMSVTENRASEIIKLSAKYQGIILKRIAEIKTNTVLKELQNFGNSASSDHELRRGMHAGTITMDDLENFLEMTEKHLKRFSEKQIVLQKERDRLFEVTRINESEIINLKKFLTELSLSFKSFSSVKEVYTQKLSKIVSIQRTVRREILNSEGHITDGAMCKLERGYAAVMQDLAETVMNVERWVERCLGRTISPEKIKQAFTNELDRVSLSSSSYQNTGLEVQLEELEKSFQKLLEEVSQARRGVGSKDTQSVTVMEVRAEYEDKLNRMKSKMKQLFEEQIIKFKEKQKREIADLNKELDKAKENLAESSKAYEEHIRALTTELWSVGEKFLIQKDEVDWLKKQQRSGSLLSLQHYHTSGLGVPVEEPSRPSDTASLRSLPVIRRNPDSKTNKKREGRDLHMSDEEGEVFDNRCLKELTSTPRAPSNSGKRLSELQWRNSLCPPHLKSSYPAETQFSQSVLEDDIKHSLGPGSTLPGRNQRKEVGITAYKKPGPPTPSKQAGRLSATDSELRESLRVEMNPHASRKTGTPSRLRALFRSTRNDTSDMTPRRRLSNIFRKK